LTFAAAQRHGLKIKATLTANSGPWHTGAPSVLHSPTGFLSAAHTAAAEEYVTRCVSRYKDHPALGQWVIWSEPVGGAERTPETLALWRAWLREQYRGDLAALNRRWRTGFASFDKVLFAEEIPHPRHQRVPWRSYRPVLDDCRFRAHWLAVEIARVKEWVRRLDSDTDLCINPVQSMGNGAVHGTDLAELGKIAGTLGASYHPAWLFTFAGRSRYPALMATGVELQRALAQQAEVTEVQCGNTLNSSIRPCAVTPDELARFWLAGLFAGAASVTGWLLNTRTRDFEAGDWGLLDNEDAPSPRSEVVRQVHDTVARILARAGQWRPVTPSARVIYSWTAQAVEAADQAWPELPGRMSGDGMTGALLLNTLLLELGVPAALRRMEDLPADGGGLAVVSHLGAWERGMGARLLEFASRGGTLLVDAASGRKDGDAALHRPWPEGFAAAGLRAADLETDPDGHALTLNGVNAGHWLLARMSPKLSAEWQPWEELRFTDGKAAVWERSFDRGKITLANGLLGASLAHGAAEPATRWILQRLSRSAGLAAPVRAADQEALTLTCECTRGQLTVILAQPGILTLTAPAGRYEDFWNEREIMVPASGVAKVEAADGVAILWRID
jgi:hypothetical protein